MGTVCSKISKGLCGRRSKTFQINDLEIQSETIDGKVKFLDVMEVKLKKIRKKQKDRIPILYKEELDQYLNKIKRTKEGIIEKSATFQTKFYSSKIHPTKMNINIAKSAFKGFLKEMKKSHLQNDLDEIQDKLRWKIEDANNVGNYFNGRKRVLNGFIT